MTHDVFLSYSSKDKAVADAACNVLERNGIRVWIAPRDIAPGSGWASSIIAGINGARVLVLIFSHHANTSAQIEREVERAINKGLLIVPFRLEDVQPSGALEYFISAPHWLDAFTPPLERHLERLAEATKGLLASKYLRAGQGEHNLNLVDAPAEQTIGAAASPEFSRPGSHEVGPIAPKPRVTSLKKRDILAGAKVRDWDFSPCRAEVVVADYEGVVHFVNIHNAKESTFCSTVRSIHRISVGPFGDTIATLESDNLHQDPRQDPDIIRVWGSQDSYELRHAEGSLDLRFSADGRWLASGGSLRADSKQTTMIWRMEKLPDTKLPRATLYHTITNPNIEVFAFDRKGTLFVTGSANGWVQLLDLTTQSECLRMYHDDEVVSVEFSAGGDLILSASKDMTAKLWDASSGELVSIFKHSDMLSRARISDDGRYVGTAGHDGARLWDRSGKLLAGLAHDRVAPGVLDIEFAPKSDFVVTGGCDDTARVWTCSNGGELARLYHSVYAGEVSPVRISAVGNVIGTAGCSDSLFLWDLNPAGQDRPDSTVSPGKEPLSGRG